MYSSTKRKKWSWNTIHPLIMKKTPRKVQNKQDSFRLHQVCLLSGLLNTPMDVNSSNKSLPPCCYCRSSAALPNQHFPVVYCTSSSSFDLPLSCMAHDVSSSVEVEKANAWFNNVRSRTYRFVCTDVGSESKQKRKYSSKVQIPEKST